MKIGHGNLAQAVSEAIAAGAMPMVIIYERPRDVPDGYVVRAWAITSSEMRPHRDAFSFPSERLARDFIAREWPGSTLLHGRGVAPDPCVIGVYL